MSRLFLRKRRTADINGMVPVVAVLLGIGFATGFSELSQRATDDDAASRAAVVVALPGPRRATAMTHVMTPTLAPVSANGVATAKPSPKVCNHPLFAPPLERNNSDRQA